MDKFKVLHLADLHLDSPMLYLSSSSEERRRELLLTFGKAVDLAKTEKVDAALFAGDLFDGGIISGDTKNYIYGKLEEIIDIPVFIVKGNHDCDVNISYPKNVHVFGDCIEKISVGPADIYGVSFSGRYCEYCNIEGFTADSDDRINIFVLHADLIPKGGQSRYNPITLDQIAGCGIDYFALGHVHDFSGINKIQGTSYAYPGIAEGRGFDELGSKGVIIADIYKNNALARFVEICQRKHIELKTDVTGLSSYREIAEVIRGDSENLYKIILTGETELFINVDLLYEMLESQYYYIKIYDETEPLIDAEQLAKEYSLKGLFVKNAMENKRALKYGLAALKGEKVSLP